MRWKDSLLMLLLTVSLAASAAESWRVEYGKEPGRVACYNANTDKSFKEDQPYGPMSFRIHHGHLWLLDSIGARIHRFDEGNALKKTFEISDLPTNSLLEDFALITGAKGEPEAIWLAEAALCEVRKISLGSGKELVKIGGNGNQPGKFLQINQIEVDRTGRLYVGDIGRAVIAVFTPYGELVRELPWQRSGFALDGAGRLHFLRYSESAGYFIVIYNSKGQLEKSLHLGMAELTNPRVWAVSDKGNLIVSFIPAGGFKGTMRLFEISHFGKIVKRLEYSPPTSMNRYLAGSEGRVWLAEADYFSAPTGQFQVKSMNWSEKK